ncbi:MAG: SIS domain-containing protein [Dorea sp.]|nr:SIS domain-containing protein [Dorea sp.]
MYYTEKEIMTQHEALRRTFEYFEGKKEEIKHFFQEKKRRKFLILGCGSSYMLAKSGQKLFCEYEDTAALAVAGGDYLLNPKVYQEYGKDSILVCLSRSGKTSEIVRSVQYAKEKYGCPVISITMEKENGLLPYSDLDLVMEWCYDQSVCQTRSVTNLYLAAVMLTAYYGNNTELITDVKRVLEENEAYKERYRPLLKEIAGGRWEKAVVLADGPVCGIAEEGALAFVEISRVSGFYANVLDYRHGPMVLNDEKTLNIVLTASSDTELLKGMLKDIQARGGILVTASDEEENRYEADLHVNLDGCKTIEGMGIGFIYIMQMLAYEKAICKGCNPDVPEGLDAYITL